VYVRGYVRLVGMDELHRTADKFERAADRLVQVTDQIDPDEPDLNAVNIALAEAKRVRRESTLLVRALGALRDKLQP
jgi:hypothetical protein